MPSVSLVKQNLTGYVQVTLRCQALWNNVWAWHHWTSEDCVCWAGTLPSHSTEEEKVHELRHHRPQFQEHGFFGFPSLVFCKVKANLVTTLNITLISSLFQRQISFTRGLLCPNQTSVCHTDFQSHPPLKNISCFLDWQECWPRLAARLGVVSDYAPQHSSPQLYVPPVSLFSTCCSQRWGCAPLESSTVVLFEQTSIYLLRVEKWDHYLYPGLKFSRMVCFLTVLWVH